MDIADLEYNDEMYLKMRWACSDHEILHDIHLLGDEYTDLTPEMDMSNVY